DDDLVLGPTSKGRWIYACSKAMDEYLALSYARSGLPVIIGRFFNVVGPRQVGRYGMVLPRFVDQALADGPLVVYDDGRQVRGIAWTISFAKWWRGSEEETTNHTNDTNEENNQNDRARFSVAAFAKMRVASGKPAFLQMRLRISVIIFLFVSFV